MKNCKGNVLVYILMAVALLGALAYTISRDGTGQEVNQLTNARTKILASELIRHAVAAEQAVFTMEQWGVNLNEIRFDKPADAGYTSNTTQQIHHPVGGGLGVSEIKDAFFDGTGTTGWAFQGNINVEWTNTTATDLIYSFINVDADICQQINKQLNGSTAIPLSTVNFTNTFTETGTDAAFTITQCAACEGIKSQCITDGTTNAFYNIVGSR